MNRPDASNCGFTLIEVLVALFITAGLAVLLVSLTSGTLKMWHRAQDAFTTDTEAKLVLDALDRDLQTALFRENGANWLAVDVTSAPSLLVNHGWRVTGITKPAASESLSLLPAEVGSEPASIRDARFGFSGAWLRFFATNVESKGASNPGGSLPIALSYQISRRPVSGPVTASNPAAIRYTFFRSAVANDTTFLTGFDLSAAGYASSSSGAPGARSARSLTNPSIADAIASNVVDFGVWLYARSGAGDLVRIFPATASDVIHTARTGVEFPVVADVMIRLLSEEGARAIESIEQGQASLLRPAGLSDAEWWWSVVMANSRVYVRRIQLVNRAS
ncbi:MAG: prepilin-type N-terminal cleavage/methylation domain-containing protein [Opitutus sp.]